MKKNLQLGIYAIFSVYEGIELEDNIIQGFPNKLSMLFLREEKPEVSVVFVKDDIDKFNKQIQKVSENIQSGNFESCKGRWCEWCDYKELICHEFG